MRIQDLLLKCLHFGVDPRKFHAPITRLQKEYNERDTTFFTTIDGRWAKSRKSAKVHYVWRTEQLREIGRIHPDDLYVPGVREWFVSGTIKLPRPVGKIRKKIGRRSGPIGETPVEAAIRELRDEVGLLVTKRDLVHLNGGQHVETDLRESSVWIGILAKEYQHHFLYDASELDEKPWPDDIRLFVRQMVDGEVRVISVIANMIIMEREFIDDIEVVTLVLARWGERTTYNPPLYAGAHN
ncbi:MAG: NUDIX domain-containing protein [Patescibacteria group bacterium]